MIRDIELVIQPWLHFWGMGGGLKFGIGVGFRDLN